MTSLHQGLVMEGRYSFRLEKVTDIPSPAELLSRDRDNEKLLKTSAIWQDSVEVEELDHISAELRRQDLKISLLLDLVGELLLKQSELPSLENIQLSASGIEFSNKLFPHPAGTKVKAVLFLLPSFPRALQFYGITSDSEREGFSFMAFQGTGLGVQDQIEKIVFTHHRRSIAHEHAGTILTGNG